MAPRIGPIARAWYKWKTLRLPWRKRFLVGFDLEGNTYWEFRVASDERWRRIVQYPRATHLADVRVSPQWHQWLRHTRAEAPPLEEQRGEVVRRARMRRLAEEADRRWDAKPRVMEDPGAAGGIAPPGSGDKEKEKEKNPWARADRKGPGEAFQPAAWKPGATGRS